MVEQNQWNRSTNPMASFKKNANLSHFIGRLFSLYLALFLKQIIPIIPISFKDKETNYPNCS